jgi:MFS family permease
MPMAATLAGDLYTIRERGRIQGYMASVWGVSSIVGPLAGGVIVESIDWHWIFWLNLPFGVISIALITLFLHETVQQRERSVDYAGTILLLLGLSTLMLALTQAGEWGIAPVAALATIATLALIAFFRQQRRAADPIMHFELWSNPIIRRGNLAVLFSGVAMIGLITFLPTFVQGVLGGSPLKAGFTLSGMSLGWPIASVIAGRTFLRFGVRKLARAGGVLVTLGGFLVALLAAQGAMHAAIGAFVMGTGLGLLSTTYIVAIQSSVGWEQRGVATATNMLMRNLGNAVGAALLGGVLNARLASYIDARGLSSVISLDSVRQLIERRTGVTVPIATEALAVLRDGLSASLLLVFWTVAVIAAAILLISWRVPDLHADRIAESERARG